MSRTSGKNQKIQFQMGWGGLAGLAFASICVLLWVFVLGFWVGQKLVGRDQHELHQIPPITDAVPKSGDLTPSPAGNMEVPKISEPSTKNIKEERLTPSTSPGSGEGVQMGSRDKAVTEKDHAADNKGPNQEGKAQKKGRYFVLQIASYRGRERADREYRRWRDKGYRMEIRKVDLGPNKGIWYRVYLGRFHSLQEAITFSEKLAKKDGLRSYVVPLDE